MITDEVIADVGEYLDDEDLYRLEVIGMEADRERQLDELWQQMVSGDISPAMYQIRAAKLERWLGYVRI